MKKKVKEKLRGWRRKGGGKIYRGKRKCIKNYVIGRGRRNEK